MWCLHISPPRSLFCAGMGPIPGVKTAPKSLWDKEIKNLWKNRGSRGDGGGARRKSAARVGTAVGSVWLQVGCLRGAPHSGHTPVVFPARSYPHRSHHVGTWLGAIVLSRR